MVPRVLALCALALAAAHTLFTSVAAGAPARPNVVFILADDWGWGDLSAHGNKLVRTPNLDHLAAEGIEFHQFNVANPVCSPSRIAFMTGQFPARFAVHEAIGAAAKNRETNQADWLDPKATTLPRLLKSAGYATGHFGKWHVSGKFADAPLPPAYGLDEHAVWTAPDAATPTDHRKVFDDAVAFITKHKGRPFYVNLWIKEAHLAHLPSEQSLKESAHLDEQQRIYSAVIADGDRGVGKVLAALKQFGLDQDTLVVFSTDNGPENTGRDDGAGNRMGRRGGEEGFGRYYSVGSTGGLRGRKRSLYEGGVRVPFIARWPGRVPAGRVDQTTVLAAVDLLPTVCAAAGVPLPDGYRSDGENMLPAMLGGAKQRTTPLLWHWRGKATPPDCWPRWAVRDGDWKLLADDAGRAELYRPAEDLAEARNLASEHPEVVKRLSAQVAAWKASLPKDPLPECVSREPHARNARGRAQAPEEN